MAFADTAENNGVTMQMKPVPCKDSKTLALEVLKKYGEEPIWFGEDETADSKYTITYNKETKTWSFIQFNDDVGCILGFGVNKPKNKT
jgi:hypothetical protein